MEHHPNSISLKKTLRIYIETSQIEGERAKKRKDLYTGKLYYIIASARLDESRERYTKLVRMRPVLVWSDQWKAGNVVGSFVRHERRLARFGTAPPIEARVLLPRPPLRTMFTSRVWLLSKPNLLEKKNIACVTIYASIPLESVQTSSLFLLLALSTHFLTSFSRHTSLWHSPTFLYLYFLFLYSRVYFLC